MTRRPRPWLQRRRRRRRGDRALRAQAFPVTLPPPPAPDAPQEAARLTAARAWPPATAPSSGPGPAWRLDSPPWCSTRPTGRTASSPPGTRRGPLPSSGRRGGAGDLARRALPYAQASPRGPGRPRAPRAKGWRPRRASQRRRPRHRLQGTAPAPPRRDGRAGRRMHPMTALPPTCSSWRRCGPLPAPRWITRSSTWRPRGRFGCRAGGACARGTLAWPWGSASSGPWCPCAVCSPSPSSRPVPAPAHGGGAQVHAAPPVLLEVKDADLVG